MNKVKWIVDEYILESRSTVGDLVGAIQQSGHDLHKTKYIPLSEEQDYGDLDTSIPTIMYGTIGFVNRCKIPFIPGQYGMNDNTNCNFYYANTPNEWMLNGDYLMVPFYKIKEDTLRLFDMLGDKLFIRPNSGRKTFAGYCITRGNYQDELSSTMQITSVSPETICIVSRAKRIDAEYRFIVGNKEVIEGSEYRWDGVLDIRNDFTKEAWEVADRAAKYKWTPDTVFCVDVAETEDGPKIVEFNGFSCAGLYACKKEVIVDRVSEIVWKDFHGLL